jgi:hypothetical protein
MEKEQTWLEKFTANYNGTSKEAKELEPFLKSTYKGDVYLPWAVMERLTYMSDPNAKFTNITNADGGLIHSDILEMSQSNIQNDVTISATRSTMMSHTVKVALEYMGKIFIEDYPLQNSKYEPAKIFDQNLVNRSLQRAKAKVAARATGIGLKLYEGFDLQFDSPPAKPELPIIVTPDPVVEPVKAEPKKRTSKKVELVEEPAPVENTIVTDADLPEALQEKSETVVDWDEATQDIIDIIRETDETIITRVLQQINSPLLKKYGWVLSRMENDDELAKKINQFPDKVKVKQSLLNLMKV